jgi:SAM-dependent methyltransferase
MTSTLDPRPSTSAPATIDFGRTAADYGKHRAGFPDGLYARLDAFGVGRAGQHVLDLGTGTGTLGRGFAERGCHVTGLDRSAELLGEARRIDRDAGRATRYVRARAEAPPFGDGAFDVVGAGQCWHWFDRAAVGARARQLLRSGGALLIAALDWVALPDSVADASETLIEEYNPDWAFRGWCYTHLRLLDEVGRYGFGDRQSFAYDLEIPYTHEAWRGRIRASAGVAASLSPERVRAFDEAHARVLAERFPQAVLQVPHRVFALIAR